MRIRTLLLLLLLSAIVIFAAMNWSAFLSPTTLSIGVGTVQAPLGLIMLGVVALVTLFFLVYVLYLQTAVLMDTRRHAKELQANRELADQAEASRFTELRNFIESTMQEQAARDAQFESTLLARIDQLDRDLRAIVEESSNALAAYIGELEDRLDDNKHGQSQLPVRRDH